MINVPLFQGDLRVREFFIQTSVSGFLVSGSGCFKFLELHSLLSIGIVLPTWFAFRVVLS